MTWNFPLAVEGVVNAAFGDNQTAQGFNVVIWRPRNFFLTQGIVPSSAPYRMPHESIAANFRSRIEARLSDLDNVGRFGGIFVIIAEPIPPLVTDHQGKAIDVYTKIICALQPSALVGHHYSLITPDKIGIGALLSVGKFGFQVVLENFVGQPLATIPGEKSVICGLARIGQLPVIIIPASPYLLTDPVQGASAVKMAEILGLIRAGLNVAEKTEQAPEWVSKISISSEFAAIDGVRAAEAVIAQANQEIAALRPVTEAANKWKELLYATDDELVSRCRAALETLGFRVCDGVGKRSDLLARLGDVILPIEVKGKNKGVEMRDITQCQGWITDTKVALQSRAADVDDPITAGYQARLRELGVAIAAGDADILPQHEVKGMLILNGFRHLPVEDRKEPIFDPNNVSDAQRQNICLLSGVDLLGLVMHALDDKSKKMEIGQKILAAAGLVKDRPAQETFLRSN